MPCWCLLPHGHGGSLAQCCSPPQGGDSLSVNPPPVSLSVPRGQFDLQCHITHTLSPHGGLPSAPFPKDHGLPLTQHFHFPVIAQSLLLSLFTAKHITIPRHACRHVSSPTALSRGFSWQLVLAPLLPTATVGFELCAWQCVHPGRGDLEGKG